MTIYPVITAASQTEILTVTYNIVAVADGSVLATRTIEADPLHYADLPGHLQNDMAAWLIAQAGGALAALEAQIAGYTITDWQRFGL